MAEQLTSELNGKRIVVVEDDFLLATDICRELRNLGATVLGPAPTPFYAMQLINHKRIDAAVLDVRLHGTMVFEVADRLRGQGVPILFATAFNRDDLPGRFRGVPWLAKPLDNQQLVAKIDEMTRCPKEVAMGASPLPSLVSGPRPPVHSFARALALRLGTA